MVITLALFVGLGAGTAMVLFGTNTEQVRVPKLTGLTVEQAEDALRSRGLELETTGREYHASIPQDHIIRTKPYEGKRVKANREIKCVISLGSADVKVPRVVGLGYREAEERVRKAGLRIEEIRRTSSSEPRDRVLKQSPDAGKKAGRSEGMVLVVSGGPKFGTIQIVGEEKWLSKRVRLTVPKGPPLQRVEVTLIPGSGEEETAYDRVHRPGDEVRVNLLARPGWRLKVLLHGNEVLSEKL